MSCAVLFEEQLRIPPINSLADFRQWLRTDDFPVRGRVDYIAGQIDATEKAGRCTSCTNEFDVASVFPLCPPSKNI
jgi:hypothetical protein